VANRKLLSDGISLAPAFCMMAAVAGWNLCLGALPAAGQTYPTTGYPALNAPSATPVQSPTPPTPANMPTASVGMAPAQLTPPAAPLVTEVRIVGNKALSVEQITSHLRTREGRPFNLETIEEDAHRLHQTGKFINVRTFFQSVPGGRIVIFEVLERPILADVKFVGNEKISKKKLAEEAKLKPGDPMNNFAVEEARRKLETFYQSKGFSKARVTLIEGDKPTDRRAVFLINEGVKQKVQIVEFIGNTIASDERLQTQIKTKNPIFYLFKGELDRKELEEDVHCLTNYYRGLGFFKAKIGYEVGPFNLSEDYDYRGLLSRVGRELNQFETAQWVVVTFIINEGPRFKIRNISVEGNSKYSSEELLADMKLQDGEFFNRDKMQGDRNSIVEKYGSVGYVFCDVKAQPRLLEEPGTMDLVYKIKEHDRYKIGRINVVIKGEYPHTKITTVLNRLSIHPGDIADIRQIRASERRLKYSQLFEVNPAQGEPPKISFTRPAAEDESETNVARRRPGSRVRMQSPDTGNTAGSRDRTVNLTLSGTAVNYENWQRLPVEPYASLLPASPQYAPRQPGAKSSIPSANPQEYIVRSQYTSSSGAAYPQLQSRLPWLNGQNQQTAVAPAPAANGSAVNYTAAQPVAAPGSPQPVYNTPAGGQPTYPMTVPAAGAAPSSAVPAGAAQPGWGQPAAVPATGIQPAAVPPAANGYVTPAQYTDGQLPPSQTTHGPFDPNSPFFGGPPDADPLRQLQLDIQATEAATGRFMVGVGVNSEAGLFGSVIIDEQNFDLMNFPRSWSDIENFTAFRGNGQRLRIEAAPGTEVQRYTITFQEPYLLDTPVSTGVSGYYFSRAYYEWFEDRTGGQVGLGYQFTPDLTGSLTYRGARINITDIVDPAVPQLAAVKQANALHGFKASLAYDTRDNMFLATEGGLIQGSIEEVIGTWQYPRAEVSLSRHFPLHERPDGSGRHVLSFNCRAGYTGPNTPVYENYYIGGFTTLRGFTFRDASPVSPINPNVYIGGEFMLLASVEYMFPITADDMLRGVVFCDSGTVEPTITDWSDRYRVAPGFGLRITVPAMGPAPIALDFAFPVSKNPTDRDEVFSFFIGFGRF
jgi:outer membrane protein insertion porin family